VVRSAIVLGVALSLAVCFAPLAKSAPDTMSGGVVRLQQGWNPAAEQGFYYTSQGTVILPVSWLVALNGPDGRPVMDPARMRQLGFIFDDHETTGNPNHWPIGFAIDHSGSTGPVPTVGLTCAACHTSQLTYHGTTLRVDGGQSNIDLDVFKKLVNDAIMATGSSRTARAAFERRAIAAGFPAAQMDAQFQARYLAVSRAAPARAAVLASQTPAGPGRNDALAVGAQVLYNYAIDVPTNTNRADGPVNYPFLWNIANLYWVQYNASLRQPMSRNVGEALGVGALTHFIDPATGSLAPEPQRWHTSINVRSIHAIETLVASLQPPSWPEPVLGPIDRSRATLGKALFTQNCAACHAVRPIGSASAYEWSVRVLPMSAIGTDRMESDNWRLNRYDGTKLGLGKNVDAASGLQPVTTAVQKQAYLDAHVPPSLWPAFDGFGRKNVMTAPCGYRARPLVGVWATPPFLHNGSVPTMFDLLSASRPSSFRFGGTEYDPKKLGFVEPSASNGTLFDSSVIGNSNKGHWFTDDRTRPGRVGRKFTDAEKYELIEFLKSTSYADYPRTVVKTADPEPCVAASKY
jgi:hypothetical protein